ncbi:MAG: hypothetical protein K9L74_01000 [Candidatus Izimaplasma sp.]|nr:hypothetical protein [Candidatus Izimaplasma bacterium]
MTEYHVLFLYSNYLKRSMKVLYYLPKNYAKTDKHYPVLYMHDGQNLFDSDMATYGTSWNILEAYDQTTTLPELIIVGIKTAGKTRADLLLPTPFKYKDGATYGGDADKYLMFIKEELKPVIDQRFRTLTSAKDTALMGSSYGGVNTIYAALHHTDTFSKFAALSNALFYGPFLSDFISDINRSKHSNIDKLYLDVGTNEAKNNQECQNYINANKDLYKPFKDYLTEDKLIFKLIEGGIHNESSWAKRFPDIIHFLFSDS